MSAPVQAHVAAGTQAILEPAGQVPRWSLATRVAFRFCFVYFSLFSLLTQIAHDLVAIPKFDLPLLEFLWPTRQIVFWTAAHVFGVKTQLTTTGSGSGDKIFDWVFHFCVLVVSLVATALWSVLDRKRESYLTLNKWFRVFLRFALASQMLIYGLIKIFPVQMPTLSLFKLVEPYGNFSPMGVLWASISATPAYETFAGSAEALGGILLLVPRTATLGALVCLADSVQVFTLNMTYDVPVKILSFHLILMSVFLLAPELARLANFFLLDRTAERSKQPQLFPTARANRIAVVAQIVFALWLVGNYLYGVRDLWHSRGGGMPKPSLYGIWNAEQLSIDGQVRAPLTTDYDHWRRIIFDFNRLSFQRMDESLAFYKYQINDKDKTVAVTKDGDKNWKATLAFQRVSPSELILDGMMDNHKFHMQLRLVDRNSFLLVSRGFHWVQELPFNR